MKAEMIPNIKLEIRPMVMSMVQTMGISGSVLAKVIEKEVEKKIADNLADIPKMVDKYFSELIKDKMYMYFNINYHVKVKLTEYGKSLMPFPKEIEEDGYTEFQLWDLMSIFGKHMYMGNKLPFKNNIKIEMKEFNPTI